MREAQERERQEEAAQKEVGFSALIFPFNWCHWDLLLQAIRQSLSDQLPEEPPANCSEAVSTLRLRCPSGETVVRRFLGQHPLQVLLNFVASKGFPCSEFKVLTTFPRKDVSILPLRLWPLQPLTSSSWMCSYLIADSRRPHKDVTRTEALPSRNSDPWGEMNGQWKCCGDPCLLCIVLIPFWWMFLNSEASEFRWSDECGGVFTSEEHSFHPNILWQNWHFLLSKHYRFLYL